ncbi:MAG: hypothetical protein Q7N50_15745 [Armatimonadota bacterium]|nr:hypothetical protein [Armatimonadota bacterium]
MIRVAAPIIIFLITLAPVSASLSTPATLSYQGQLLNASGQPVPDGIHSTTFRIFDTETGGSQLWSEDISVNVIGGWINVILGNAAPINLPFDKQYWLQIEIGGQTLMPRAKLTSVPYAMNAERAGGFKVSVLPTPSTILPLDLDSKLPNEVLKTGHTKGLDADTVDGLHLRDIISKSRTTGQGIRVEKYPFTDLHDNTGEYTHITNGRVGVLVESGFGATTWAMDSQTVVEGQCAHCIDWEPYTTAYNQYKGVYQDNPNPELAGASSCITLLDKVCYFKDEQTAMSGTSGGDAFPLLLNKNTEQLVFMHRHILYPFRPVGDKYPAIQIIGKTGQMVGWDSTAESSDFGTGTPNIANAVRCGWDGSSESIVGIIFNWNDAVSVRTDEYIQMKLYIHQVVSPGPSWSLIATFFPASARYGGSGQTSVSSDSLPTEGWSTWNIPIISLRKGTNCVLLRTNGGSASRYVLIGAGPVQTKLLKKNYLLSSYEPGAWNNLRRVSEYFVIYRDSDRIKTWGKVDSGSDVRFDFIGAALGSKVRRTAEEAEVDLAASEPFPRGIKSIISPTKLENPKLGVKTILDPGYTPTVQGTTLEFEGANDALTGLAGENRYITFSRDGAYPVKYIFEDPGAGISISPRISSFNDPYAGGVLPGTQTMDPLGYTKSWTDAPCAGSGIVPAGSRTWTVIYDYSQF